MPSSLPLAGFTSDDTHALPLHVLDRDGFAAWNARQPASVQAWLQHQQFTAAAGTAVLLPGEGGVAGAVLGVGDRADAYAYAHAPFALPAGSRWQLASELADADVANLQLGWGLGSYRFSRYRKPARLPAQLVATPAAEVRDVLAACLRVRDWVNTPTEDMGPQQLEDAARELAQAHGAKLEVIVGDELL